MFFKEMFGAGGSHEHGGGDEEPVDTEKLYNVLGVSKNATDKEIKKAFKKAALQHHPDRGGDAEMFKEIENAKDILTDPGKRRLYDRYGERGVERGGGGRDMFDLFTGGRSQQSRGNPKPQTITQKVDITLEDVYKGSVLERKWKIKTATIKNECTPCGGVGAVKHVVRQGPMLLQSQRKCDSCGGRGFLLPDEIEVEKAGTVHVPHGITNGGKITLSGEGHNLPGCENGDVTFIVRLKKHNVFHRDGADLGCEHILTLYQALCGYEFKLKHVSGKALIIKSKPDEIVQPGDLKILSDYGLPQKGNHYVHGHLYVKFKVVFPIETSLSFEQRDTIRSTLEEVEYPEMIGNIELGQGSRVKVSLTANAAEKIYGEKKEMTALGVIANEQREGSDTWQVELEMKDGQESSNLVVVPADWVEAAEESSCSPRSEISNEGNKNKRRNINSNSQNEEEEDFDIEEIVTLETVTGGAPEPTPAEGGSAYDDGEEERQGVQCQQM